MTEPTWLPEEGSARGRELLKLLGDGPSCPSERTRRVNDQLAYARHLLRQALLTDYSPVRMSYGCGYAIAVLLRWGLATMEDVEVAMNPPTWGTPSQPPVTRPSAVPGARRFSQEDV